MTLDVQREHREVDDRVAGSVRVGAGGSLTLHGTITGDLLVEAGGVANVFGSVLGDVVNNGGELAIFGVVFGVVRTIRGKTTVDPRAEVQRS